VSWRIVDSCDGHRIGYRAIVDEDGETICNPSPMGDEQARLIISAQIMFRALDALLANRFNHSFQNQGVTTMRLTKYIREAFVRAAMNDVPQIDYNEQAKALAEKTLLEIMPASIKKLLKDKEAEQWINREYICIPGRLQNFYGHASRGDSSIIKIKKPEAWTELVKLSELAETQRVRREELRRKLEACAESVTTRAALVELLPEFEKYLPADEKAAIKTLPAVANVVADFTAAGWPKGKKPARKAA